MPDINITVAHKVAVSDTQSIVCDNSDYTVHWTLDEDWSAYDTKTMRTIYMDGTFTDKVFSGAEVELPVCTVPGVVQIGLFAGDIRTSRVAILRALPSVRSAAGAPADPTPDVYDQLMELIKGLGGADPDDIAKAVADYLAAHPIEETDPTVPEWAKAETKPTYSAAEVGAIAQSDLQAATDAALAQAKASGEFDGATGPAGPAGPQGPAGAPGKDGAGMDVTGAAVGQIAKIAAVDESGVPTAWSPVDMPTGGGGETWEKIAEIDFDVDAANDVSVWEYKNLPNYKELAYRKVSLVSSTEQASGLSISINGSQSQPSGIWYAKKGGQSNGWGEILLLPFGWVHVSTADSTSPTNHAAGSFIAMYNAIQFSGESITSVRLVSHSIYKIAGGKLSLYGRR